MSNNTVIHNGELREIHQRLLKLEIMNEERWGSHDKISSKVWDEIKDKLDVLFNKIDDLKKKGSLCVKESRDYTNMIIRWVIGIPVTITVLILVYKAIAK